MTDRWLTVKEAAVRVGVSATTVKRYIERDGLQIHHGRVREQELLDAEKAARRRMRAGKRTARRQRGGLRSMAEAYFETAEIPAAERARVEEFIEYAEESC